MAALIALLLSLVTLLCTVHGQDDISWLLAQLTTTAPVNYTAAPMQELTTNSGPTLPLDTKMTGCGRRQESGISGRILGVNDAIFGEFPWVVAIFKYKSLAGNYTYCCVGSLIHHKVVLTVKHHFKRQGRVRVRAGDWDIAAEYETYNHQTSDVESIVGHTRYDPGTNAYDAALLFLSTSINLAPNVEFACLPPPGSITPADTRCFVAGWGQDVFEPTNSTHRNILKMIDVPVVDNGVCQSQLRIITKRDINLSNSMMCAGGERGKDACLKDGGAPLVCPYQGEKGRYYQAGIVSWGVKCGLANVPGVYTSVPLVRDWIDATMAARKYEITYLPPKLSESPSIF